MPIEIRPLRGHDDPRSAVSIPAFVADAGGAGIGGGWLRRVKVVPDLLLASAHRPVVVRPEEGSQRWCEIPD
jgi:hypothetical protein